MLIEEDAWWYYSYDATWYRPLSATSLNISENSTMAVKNKLSGMFELRFSRGVE